MESVELLETFPKPEKGVCMLEYDHSDSTHHITEQYISLAIHHVNFLERSQVVETLGYQVSIILL